MSQTARDVLRAKILGDKPKSSIVTLDDGVQIEVRQTTVGSMLDAIGIEDTKARMAQMLVISCFVPGTNDPLFEVTDLELIMGLPSGGYYQKLIDAMNSFNPDKGVAEAKKD